jgi:hypothetical protein
LELIAAARIPTLFGVDLRGTGIVDCRDRVEATMRSFSKVLVSVGALLLWSGTSRAADPTTGVFWWESDAGPVTMWPTSQGYCILETVDIGNSTTDKVSIDIKNGNWVMSGSTSSDWISTYAIAECTAWPHGWTSKTAPWINGYGQNNVASNNCFCTIGGLAYSSVPKASERPQAEVHGYPTTNSRVTLTEYVTNDESTGDMVKSNCVCPTGGPNLWSGSSGNLTLVTIGAGQNTSVKFSSYHVCGIVNMQGPSLGGGIELEMFGGSSVDQYTWFFDTQGAAGGFYTAACIPWQ